MIAYLILFYMYKCPHCLPSCITFKIVERNQIEYHLMHIAHSQKFFIDVYKKKRGQFFKNILKI